ncbi:lanthionine synthetase LanC family protein, partial [Priestia megaterium]
ASTEIHKLCKGSTGYGISLACITNDDRISEEQRSILLKILNVNGVHEKWDDGLCHGNSGDIELFVSILENSTLKPYHEEAR